VRNQILSYFGKTWLDKRSSKDINNWLPDFKERKAANAAGKEEIKSYKDTYANTVLRKTHLLVLQRTDLFSCLWLCGPATGVCSLWVVLEWWYRLTRQWASILFSRNTRQWSGFFFTDDNADSVIFVRKFYFIVQAGGKGKIPSFPCI
jgi:hypothetical protein